MKVTFRATARDVPTETDRFWYRDRKTYVAGGVRQPPPRFARCLALATRLPRSRFCIDGANYAERNDSPPGRSSYGNSRILRLR
jgi:hypothetical protein